MEQRLGMEAVFWVFRDALLLLTGASVLLAPYGETTGKGEPLLELLLIFTWNLFVQNTQVQ